MLDFPLLEKFANKCLAENPDYDVNNYKKNFKEEVRKICNK